MSVRLVVLAALLAWPAMASAQSEGQGSDRFFAEKGEDEDAGPDSTLYQGSLVSTSFGYRETGSIAQNLTGGVVGVENASSVDRVFTDLRARLTARHIKGSSYDFHGDARARVTPDERFGTQTGLFGDNEYEVRELYARKYGVSADVTVGRQHVLELAATKIDGLRVDYAKNDHWIYLGFLGLYPSRTSRSIEDDYPQAAPEMIGGEPGKRIMPVAGGIGGAYRYRKYYGAVGAVGIMPLADEQLEGAPRAEQPRVFLTANGYYRRSSKLDIFHFVVLDVAGSNVSDRDEIEGTTLGKIPLTNLSVGATYRPNFNLRITGAVNRVDTETLNAVAQTRLEDPDPGTGTIVQNNIEVQRISQQSARLGVSAAFKERRFELSASSLVRQRPEITVTQPNDTEVVIPAAQAFEFTVGFVDRRSIKGHRIGATLTAIQGFGDSNLYRTDANVGRLYASREVKDGKGEYELSVTYVQSSDENRDECLQNGPEPGPFGNACFGTTKVNTIQAGGLLFYRPKKDWFVIGNLSAASQGITVIDTMAMTEVSQPRILILTGLLRIAYRF
jgi:hypothetical protein